MRNKDYLFYYNKKFPNVASSVFIASGSKIIGDVDIGLKSSIWFNCVIRGDVNYTRIGENTNIQDGSVIHVSSSGFSATGGNGFPTEIGNNVTIGHNATIHACKIEDFTLIGMGSVVLDGSIVEEMGFVAAGAIVPPRTIIKKNELWAGNPAKFIRNTNEKEKNLIRNTPETYSRLRKEFLKKEF